MLFNILMYAIMIYMIFRMFSMNKGATKRRMVINVVNQVQDKEAFFAAADDLIANAGDEVIAAKTKIIKLWGMCYHKDYEGFEEVLSGIDLKPLFSTKKGALSIEENEDSFFYFLLAIPNMLYGNDRNDLRNLVEEKAHEYDELLSKQLIKAVADHCKLFYDKTEDQGESFFRSVSAGDYPGYVYSKQLIGVYKNVCDTMTCKILQDRGDDISEYEGYAQSFANSGVGRRWINCLGLKIDMPAEEGEEAETEETEDTADEAEKTVAEEPVSEAEETEIPEETSEEVINNKEEEE